MLKIGLSSLGTSSKKALLLLVIFVACLLCVFSLPAFNKSKSCSDLNVCNRFLPICATFKAEHQFFYSHCDMLREICLTGKDWKSDFLSHCNVSKI